MSDVIEQLRKIEEYFKSSPSSTSDPHIIQCDHNSLLDMAVCLTDTEIYSEGKEVTEKLTNELTIFFPNDGEGYHIHFDQISDLLLMCRRIFEETMVFSVSSDGKVIYSTVDLTSVNDRLNYEETFTEPKSIANHESHVYVREEKLISWNGSKSGILTIKNLDDFF